MRYQKKRFKEPEEHPRNKPSMFEGAAEVVGHGDGWALPGGGFTTNEVAARAACHKMAKMIGDTKPTRTKLKLRLTL